MFCYFFEPFSQFFELINYRNLNSLMLKSMENAHKASLISAYFMDMLHIRQRLQK